MAGKANHARTEDDRVGNKDLCVDDTSVTFRILYCQCNQENNITRYEQHEREANMMDKKELVESDLEKVAGGKCFGSSPEKDLSDEDREKLKELEREISERM